jgi:hypothetical protein
MRLDHPLEIETVSGSLGDRDVARNETSADLPTTGRLRSAIDGNEPLRESPPKVKRANGPQSRERQ